MRFRKLIILLSIFTLCSCGTSRPLDKDEILQIANRILQKQETLELPTTYTYESKTISSSENNGNLVEDQSTFRIITTPTFYHFHEESSYFINDSYLYIEGKTFTVATHYRTSDFLYQKYNQATLPSSNVKIQDLIFSAGNLIDNFSAICISENEVFYSGFLLNLPNYFDMVVNQGYSSYNRYDLEGRSKGKGSLSVKIDWEVVYGSYGSEHYTYTDYMCTSIFIENKTISGGLPVGFTELTNISYTAKPVYPNLSIFQKVTNK